MTLTRHVCTDIKVCSSYKYLGVTLGYVFPEEAFALGMQKAMGRALSMQHWKLTLRERVFLLELCILPVFVYPFRVIYPVKQVVKSLKVICNIALGLNTWRLTHEILALPEQEGGMGLAMPRDFLP